MPAPHSFWVILIGKTPTSFRGKMRQDLLPTLRQLQRTQKDVTLRWFERGKIWESPEAAAGAARLAATEARERRPKEWRPGGDHRDPKARFEMTRDQKRAKFKRDRSPKPDRPESPFGPRPPREKRPGPENPFGERGSRPPRADDRAPRSDSRDRRGDDRPSGDRPSGERPPRRNRPTGPPMENPFKKRPRSDRAPDSDSRPRPDTRRPGRPTGGRGGSKPPKRRT